MRTSHHIFVRILISAIAGAILWASTYAVILHSLAVDKRVLFVAALCAIPGVSVGALCGAITKTIGAAMVLLVSHVIGAAIGFVISFVMCDAKGWEISGMTGAWVGIALGIWIERRLSSTGDRNE